MKKKQKRRILSENIILGIFSNILDGLSMYHIDKLNVA